MEGTDGKWRVLLPFLPPFSFPVGKNRETERWRESSQTRVPVNQSTFPQFLSSTTKDTLHFNEGLFLESQRTGGKTYCTYIGLTRTHLVRKPIPAPTPTKLACQQSLSPSFPHSLPPHIPNNQESLLSLPTSPTTPPWQLAHDINTLVTNNWNAQSASHMVVFGKHNGR